MRLTLATLTAVAISCSLLYQFLRAPDVRSAPVVSSVVASAPQSTPSEWTAPNASFKQQVTSASAKPLQLQAEPATDHQWKRIRQRFAPTPRSSEVRREADGSLTGFLGGRGTSAAAARLLPDGRIVTGCFTEFDGLADFLEPDNGTEGHTAFSGTTPRLEK